MNRSAIYKSKADQLARTCLDSIDDQGQSRVDARHGKIFAGTVFYCAGEMVRVRGASLDQIAGRDFAPLLSTLMETQASASTLERCFTAMGLGMMGSAGPEHPLAGASGLADLEPVLRVTEAYPHNWEVFNASLRIGRSLLYREDPALALPHLEMLDKKYQDSGYFDDSKDCGDYNNYGLMTINFALRAVELLARADPVRIRVEEMFRPHAFRYFELLQTFVGSDGMGWLFGRSAGVLGQLQCLVFLEQLLSKGWLDQDQSPWARCACRKLFQYMEDVFWDSEENWYLFRDDFRTCYPYRNTLPMAWDLWRYFLQLEDYAAQDELRGTVELDELPAGPVCREIVTSKVRNTSYLVWSDGRIKWQMPVMGGPTWLAGDNLPRPYCPGLFEWCTSGKAPVLCPRLTVDGVQAWPAWWPSRPSILEQCGNQWTYRIFHDTLVDDHGNPMELPLSVETIFRFGAGFLEREDRIKVNSPVTLDEIRMEVLQGSAHPSSRAYPPVRQLRCALRTDISGITLDRDSVTEDPDYRNYFAHPSGRWTVSGTGIRLELGTYPVCTRIEWD